MSVAELHDVELAWPSPGPTDVVVTGTFDHWSASVRLAKGDVGFSGTVKVPWGEKIAYKFIVDGRWRCRDDCPQEDDGHGNVNNVLLAPDKPHEPPARLSIPLEPDGFGDVEDMLTAVEFLPMAEPAALEGSVPAPRLSVEGLGQAPSTSESRLDTAAATEGHVSPTMPPKLTSFEEAPSSHDVATLPINDKEPVSLPVVNGAAAGHAVANGELPTSPPVPEARKEAVSESAVSQPSLHAASRDGRAAEESPAAALAAKQSRVDSVETAAQTSIVTSSTPTHRKRRSLFARIKHVFGKKEKQ